MLLLILFLKNNILAFGFIFNVSDYEICYFTICRYYGIPEELIVVTPVGQSLLVDSPQTYESFTVTALEADHCPGSVMFYFQVIM